MRLCVLANVRLPTEKAHGVQIVENCEALARAGAAVTLVAPRRRQRGGGASADLRQHYGIEPSFALRRVPCLDLLPYERRLGASAAIVQMVTYAVTAAAAALRSHADACLSRDVLPLLLLGLIVPARRLAYEAHTIAPGRLGGWLQRACVRRVGTVIAVTDRLAEELTAAGARRVLVLRDGFRRERFAALPAAADARARVNVPRDAFTVGYLGQLETMGAAKGLDTVVDAVARIARLSIHLCLVGGSARRAEALRSRWLEGGLPAERFHWTPDVPPAQAPAFLPAFDVCVLPLPATRHFAHYASPLKLFEYMAAGRAIVASSLPSLTEVLVHGSNAWLVRPEDPAALADALAALHGDAGLRERLGAAARQASIGYEWDHRARRLLDALETVS